MQIKTNRIESIDVLRGVVMVIMALDHVRDYFYFEGFFGDPMNLDTTTPALFFTRFITHYCAPVFVFLAGTSAFLYGSKKTKKELSKFLFTRGIWLIFLEIVVNNLIWKFDLTYSRVIFQVLWAIGFSMISLSILIYLNKKVLLAVGFILIAGHNLLDGIVMQGSSFLSTVWYFMHQAFSAIPLGEHRTALVFYPALPWIGVIILGYCFGTFYQRDFDAAIRKKWLLKIGFGAIALFFIIRGINVYGDLVPWTLQDTTSKTVMSFFKVTKYPPSLAYLLITLGPALLFLFAFEKTKNKITDFFLVFGRVPFFYYFLHVFVIHILAIIVLVINGDDWKLMIFTFNDFGTNKLVNYGYSLPVVYLVWLGVIALLYPISKKYMIYKANNKDKWWLSYL